MPTRACIFTGLIARQKNAVVSKSLDEDLNHNWVNSVPCNKDYNEFKEGRLPTEDELEAVRLFFKLEMARIEVAAYENKLAEIQSKIRPAFEEFIKNKQIKISHIENELLEEVKPQLKDILEERKRNLFE